MKLDFSKIDSLGSPQKPSDTFLVTDYIKLPETSKKPVEAKIEPKTQGLQRKADNRKKQLEDSTEVLKKYQTHRRLTNGLVADITKGLQQGADIYDLFFKGSRSVSINYKRHCTI